MMGNSKLSIRWKLTIWNATAFALILITFGVGVYQLLKQAHFQMLDKSLVNRVSTLEASLSKGLSAPDAIQAWVTKFGQHGDYFALVRDGQQNTIGVASGLSDVDINRLLPNLVNHYSGTVIDERFGRIRYISREFNPSGLPLRLYVFTELEHLDEELLLVRRTFLWLIPPTLLLASGLSYWLAVRALAPVEQLRIRTDSITASDLHQRIPISNDQDEIGQLTGTINSLFSRLEEAFDEIKRFTGDASHELRTPIAIIRSEAELGLQLNEDPARTSARLQSIVEECTRLTKLTSQLLSLSRAESAVDRSALSEISLDGLLADVIDSLKPTAQDARVSVNLQSPESACSVKGDYESLRQLFYNLIDNAIKYNVHEGRVDVQFNKQGQVINVEVLDSGHGIANEHLPKIFDRFFRIENESTSQITVDATPVVQGSGLGLSIVSRIVTNHGGRCEVSSELGKGTSFQVILPAV